MGTCLVKNGWLKSACLAVAGPPPIRAATMEGASAGVTFSYRMFSGSTATSGPPLHRPRHPTPVIWTLSARPASPTAASKLCLTACAFAERHPAATQTRIRTPVWPWRSFSPISSSSVRSILEPSFHVAYDTLRRLAADDRPVQDDGRGDAAGAYTARLDEGHASVGP